MSHPSSCSFEIQTLNTRHAEKEIRLLCNVLFCPSNNNNNNKGAFHLSQQPCGSARKHGHRPRVNTRGGQSGVLPTLIHLLGWPLLSIPMTTPPLALSLSTFWRVPGGAPVTHAFGFPGSFLLPLLEPGPSSHLLPRCLSSCLFPPPFPEPPPLSWP